MSREAIHAALFALFDDITEIQTKSRKLLHWNDVPPTKRPALFQAQSKQTVLPTQANGLPSRWYYDVLLYVYVSTAGEEGPGQVLNPLLDKIVAKLDPTPFGPQRLGGLVEWVRIEGAISTMEGTLGNDEVAEIPVRILTV